jgi:hypothetical protein
MPTSASIRRIRSGSRPAMNLSCMSTTTRTSDGPAGVAGGSAGPRRRPRCRSGRPCPLLSFPLAPTASAGFRLIGRNGESSRRLDDRADLGYQLTGVDEGRGRNDGVPRRKGRLDQLRGTGEPDDPDEPPAVHPLLTNAFSKKLENHTAALGLFHAHYNLCRIHRSLRVTPAMAAGVTTRVWEIADLVGLLPTAEGQKRGPYRKAVSSN